MRQRRVDSRQLAAREDNELQKLSFKKKYLKQNRLQGKSNLRDYVKDYNGK